MTSDKADPMAASVEHDDDFATLLAQAEASTAKADSLEIGVRVVGVVEVISLEGEEIFLDLGGKATGYILKADLPASAWDDDGILRLAQGDRIEGVAVGTDVNGVRVRAKFGRQHAGREALAQAFEAGLPVEGKIVGVNKGGFEIEVAGGRGFCPMSQMEFYRPPEPETYVGKTLSFKVTELRGGEPILSRQALLRASRAEEAAAIRASLEPGARLRGIVRSIQPFGAFVDLGGIDGLIHISELDWDHVKDPHDVVALGQAVEVVVLEIDRAKDRIALSLRRALGDPFAAVTEGLDIGSVVEGRVARLTHFGAFVTLPAAGAGAGVGVDGLVHISDMAHYRVRHPKEIVAVGDTVRVKVIDLDPDQRRISLSLKALAEDPWDSIEARYKPGQTVTGQVASIQTFGVFIDLEPGITALLPSSESGVPQGQPLQGTFRVGKPVEARVLRVETAARKIALTTRAEGDVAPTPRRVTRGRSGLIRRRPEASPCGPRTWIDRDDTPPAKPTKDGKSVGSLGALLLAALEDDEGK